MAVWNEVRSDENDVIVSYVMASFLQMGGIWSAPVQISNAFEDYSSGEWTPDVGAGVVTIVAATYSSVTNTWSAPFTLDTTGTNYEKGGTNLPKTDIDPNGNVVAVWDWKAPFGAESRIYGASFTPGLGWGPSIIIDQSTDPIFLDNANVVIDCFGKSTAIWNYGNYPEDGPAILEVFSSELPLSGVWSNQAATILILESNAEAAPKFVA